MSQLDLSSVESLKTLNWNDPVLVAWVVWSLKKQVDQLEEQNRELATKRVIIGPSLRRRKVEKFTCPELLTYFFERCDDVWKCGSKVATEFWTILPVKMYAFMKGNGLSGPQYRRFIDFIIDISISNEEAPPVNLILSRGLLQMYRVKESAIMDASKDEQVVIPLHSKLPDNIT
jgi:hypothetical protein